MLFSNILISALSSRRASKEVEMKLLYRMFMSRNTATEIVVACCFNKSDMQFSQKYEILELQDKYKWLNFAYK